MSSVADILQALAENAGQAQLRKGAIYGGLVSGAAQLPAQISADREHDAALKLQQAHLQQQMDLERSRAAREDQLARHQDTADQQAAKRKAIASAAFASGIQAHGDPSGPFDAMAAFKTASDMGDPSAVSDAIAQHRAMLSPLTEHDPTKALRNETGATIVPAVPKSPSNPTELAVDAANPASPTQARSTTALDLSKPPKPEKPALTYGAPFSATVGGKSKFVRAGSDGKVYSLDGKEVPSDQIQPEGDKAPANSYQLQPELDATGKQTGRFLGYNTKTNTWEPVKGAGPASTKAAPGAAAIATEAKTKTDTLNTLSQLDTAIEAAKAKIGPGAGRVSNIEQMIGSADPEVQALGVKMKAAKMQFDHAITGSVRAGASPLLIKQWDNILANKVTPEGLKAGVQAMRELLGGKAPGSGIKSITEIK